MAGRQKNDIPVGLYDGDEPTREKVVGSLKGSIDPTKAVTVPERVELILRLRLLDQYHPGKTALVLSQQWGISLGRYQQLAEAASVVYAVMLRQDPQAVINECLSTLHTLESECRRRGATAGDRDAVGFYLAAVRAVEIKARMADAELDRRFHRDMAREKAEREERRQLTQGMPEFRVNMVVPELPAKKDA